MATKRASVNIRMKPGLKERLEDEAREEGVSLSSYVTSIIIDDIRARKEEEGMRLSDRVEDLAYALEDVGDDIDQMEDVELIDGGQFRQAARALRDASRTLQDVEEERARKRAELRDQLDALQDEYDQLDDDDNDDEYDDLEDDEYDDD